VNVLSSCDGHDRQGVLRECLLDSGVRRVVTVVRRPTGRNHSKLTELFVPISLYSPPRAAVDRLRRLPLCLGV